MALRSQTQLSRGVWFCGCCRHAARGVAGTVVTALRCGRGHHATCGVPITVVAPVFAPRVVPRALSPRRAWCRRCSHHATRGAAGVVVAARVVSQALCCRAARGVAGAVVAPRVVSRALSSDRVVAVAMPRAVSSLLSWHVKLSSVAVVVPHVVVVAVVHHVWCRGHDRHAAWCRESVVSGLKKRELAEKDKRNLTCSRECHGGAARACRDKVRGGHVNVFMRRRRRRGR